MNSVAVPTSPSTAKPRALQRLAEHVAQIHYEELPAEAIQSVRRVVLDFLGVTLGGYRTPLGQLASAYAVTNNPPASPQLSATLIGDGRSATLEGAAWANAVMSCILGMSDSHRLCSHVASEVVPTALAVGQAVGLDGRSFISAIAAGYDVFGAIQPVVKAPQRVRGLDHKGQVGSLAAAAVAAKAWGLNAQQIGNAVALAADMACGTEQYTFDAGHTDTEGLTAGFGVRNGINAAGLAAFGFRGPPGALDGPYGYFHAFGDGFDSTYLDQLGKISMVATTGLKPHSGCRHVHPCVDATQALLSQAKPPLDEITEIEIGTYKSAVTPAFRINPHPEDVDAAGYSLPATVAVVLARGSWYREDIESYAAPACQRLWPLVRTYVDPEIDAAHPQKNGCVVRVTLRDGTRLEGRIEYAKGEPENMLTTDELYSKFRRVVGSLLTPAQIEEIFDLVDHLDQLDDITPLLRMTVPL
ncbi:hypothetical protein GC175_11980 [bacterium]|nr:hypothetical protein [bacterium]